MFTFAVNRSLKRRFRSHQPCVFTLKRIYDQLICVWALAYGKFLVFSVCFKFYLISNSYIVYRSRVVWQLLGGYMVLSMEVVLVGRCPRCWRIMDLSIHDPDDIREKFYCDIRRYNPLVIDQHAISGKPVFVYVDRTLATSRIIY